MKEIPCHEKKRRDIGFALTTLQVMQRRLSFISFHQEKSTIVCHGVGILICPRTLRRTKNYLPSARKTVKRFLPKEKEILSTSVAVVTRELLKVRLLGR